MYYLSILQKHLTPEQILALAEKAVEECEFWPNPARLLRLAGIPSEEQKKEADNTQTEKDALDGLAWFLKVLRGFRHESTETRIKRMGELKVPPLSEKTWVKTLVKFGGGNLDSGVELLLQHPSLRQNGDEVSGFGLDLNSVQKCEQRWVKCWRGEK